MANDLVPQPKRLGTNGNGRPYGQDDGGQAFAPPDGKVYDPLVPLEFVDTDSQSAGLEWDLPPVAVSARARRSDSREAQRHARDVEAEARHARVRGQDDLAAARENDAAELRQGLMDWGDLKTWTIIFAMFFGFLLFVAFVYYMPHGRHNQNDGPMPVPGFRGY